MDPELKTAFSQDYLDSLLPEETSDRFFDALYGDAEEGAYDIRLAFVSAESRRVVLSFNLVKRAGKCLVCSLTYGLPNVFARHPQINIKGMVDRIEKDKGLAITQWQLGDTQEESPSLHIIPLYLDIEP